MKTNKAVFLDRDGVINHDTGYVHKIKDFKWMVGAKQAIKYLTKKKYKIIIITNQAGIARGYYNVKDLKKLNKWIHKECKKTGGIINEIYFCPHHPTAGIGKFKKKCKCRKPGNLLIKRAIKKWKINVKISFMIGDQKSDKLCASKSKLKFFYKSKASLYKQILKIDKLFLQN